MSTTYHQKDTYFNVYIKG